MSTSEAYYRGSKISGSFPQEEAMVNVMVRKLACLAIGMGILGIGTTGRAQEGPPIPSRRPSTSG